MTLQRRSLSPIARRLAFVLLALMLLIRIGPLCETMALAAGPVAVPMMDCASKPADTSAKHVPPAACATQCVAMPAETAVGVERRPFPARPPLPARLPGLEGTVRAPATPPPRSA